MAYEKRVCVLKQMKKGFTADGGALSGAVYAERTGSTLTVTPRILGIAPLKEGQYALAVWAGGKTLCASLSGNSVLFFDAPSLKDGFAALLVYLRGEAEPLAYGRCGSAPENFDALFSAFREEEKKRKKQLPVPNPPIQTPAPAPNVPLAPVIPVPEPPDSFRERAVYDDEAIAAENYFGGARPDADEKAPSSACGEETAQADGGGAHADETLAPTRGSLTYYKEVRERLETAFRTYPKDERLKFIFPASEWVNADGSLLGILYENGKPRYLCVAVEKKGDPPAEMQHCRFVPASAFSEEKGYWVVFQDADTGEYVTVYDS